MDYLPYPRNSLLPPITVPYLPGYKLDDGDYFKFPKRAGRPRCSEAATREDASLLQEWLFFGVIDLISDLSDQPLDRSSFVRRGNINGESCDVIDASPVTALLERLATRLRGRRDFDAVCKRICLRLRYAAIACMNFQFIREGEESLLAVHLSIAILVEFLANYFSLIILPGYTLFDYLCEEPRRLGPTATWATAGYSGNDCRALSSLLMRRLLANGWCEHQVRSLECYNSYMTTYYLSSVKRSEPKGISHHVCTASACEAYNTNENYNTKHASEECDCVFQKVDEHAVVDILASKGIPLISMHEDDDGNMKMEVVPFTDAIQYTALSHVWIDGLGKNEGNALPDCQVRRLFRELKMHGSLSEASFEYPSLGSSFLPSTKTGVVFWMDTLCIPVRSEHAHLRRRAINQMALVYSAAQATLVLDEELRHSEEESEGREGLLARCLASKWNTRCWTLQEGMLAHRCIFQLKDCVINISCEPKFKFRLPHQTFGMLGRLLRYFLAPSLFGIGYSSTAHSWLGTNLTFVQKVLCHELQHACAAQARTNSEGLGIRYTQTRLQSRKAVEHFFSMWTTLANRSTTKVEDLHVILANLTDFKASDIQQLPQLQDRTRVMLQNLDHFPVRIMYDEGYRPLVGADHPDRWMPAGPFHKELGSTFGSRDGVMVEPMVGVDVLMLIRSLKKTWELRHRRVYRIQTAGMFAKGLDIVITEYGHSDVYHLDRKICSGDKLKRTDYQAMYLIFDAGRDLGALFLSKDTYREEEHMGEVLQLAVCRFDCPVSIYRVGTLGEVPEDSRSPFVRGESLPETVHLAVECSSTTGNGSSHALRSKDFCRYDDESWPIDVKFFFASVAVSTWLSRYLRHVLPKRCVTSHWASALVFCGANSWVVASYCFRRWTVRRSYKEWIRTFQEDWSP